MEKETKGNIIELFTIVCVMIGSDISRAEKDENISVQVMLLDRFFQVLRDVAIDDIGINEIRKLMDIANMFVKESGVGHTALTEWSILYEKIINSEDFKQ